MRKTLCIPGGNLENITKVISKLGDSNGSVIVNVGTNNLVVKTKVKGTKPIPTRNSEDLYNKYKELIVKLSKRNQQSFLVGILPRLDSNKELYSRLISINERVKTLCKKMKVGYIDMWETFSKSPYFYKRDGLHLNLQGSKKYAILLEQSLNDLGF